MDAPSVPDGIAVGLLDTAPEREALWELFRSVAEVEGWRPGEDIEGEEGRSACVAASVGGRLAGGVCVRSPDAAGRLPMYATWPELAALASDRTDELVLIALAPEFRATPGLLWALCGKAWRTCADDGVTDLLAAVPPRNLRIYRRLGWLPETVGPQRDHWGEPCLPCRIGIAEVAREFERRAESSAGHALALRVAHRG